MKNIKLVFSSIAYTILAGVIFFGMLIPLLMLSEFIFVKPFFIFHIPSEQSFGFVLILAVSVMSAIVIPMNVYRIRILRKSASKIGGGVLGSIIGASAGICSCGPFGFALISTFGAAAGTATAFLSNYEILLRLGSVGLLCLVYYTTTKSISSECKIN